MFLIAGGLGQFSDRLLLPQFLAPICLTTFGLALFRVISARKVIEMLVLCACTCALARGIQFAFAKYGFILLPLHTVVDYNAIRASWLAFREGLPVWVKGQRVLIIVFLTFIPAAAVVSFRSLWSVRSLRETRLNENCERRAETAAAAIALIGLFCCICNLGAVVVSGAARQGNIDRYLLAAAFIPFLFGGICCRVLPSRPRWWLGRCSAAAITLFAFIELGFCHREEYSSAELQTRYPLTAQVLDRLAQEGKIDHGLATYWNARALHYQTHERVEVRAIHWDGQPWLHSQNPNAYLAPGRGSLKLPRYNFVIFTEQFSGMIREQLQSRFGIPRETVGAGDCEIWIYDGLLGNDLALFLRSALAPRCRNEQAYVGPISPAGLAKPKANLIATRRSRFVEMPSDGEVRLTFAGPTHGELIDVGAHFDAHFDLLFYRDDEIVGKLYVRACQQAPRWHTVRPAISVGC